MTTARSLLQYSRLKIPETFSKYKNATDSYDPFVKTEQAAIPWRVKRWIKTAYKIVSLAMIATLNVGTTCIFPLAIGFMICDLLP